MNFLQAIILGIVQGLTEFIPISSTAHMVFAARMTGIYGGDPQQVTATMAVVQLGTLAAVFIYFAKDIWSIITAFVRDHLNLVFSRSSVQAPRTDGGRHSRLSEGSWLGWLVIIGSIPIGTVGFVFKDLIEGSGTKNLWFIAIMLIAIALGLIVAEKVGKQAKDITHLGIWDAAVQGFCQVLALMPGASRSGSTIMGGLLAGEKRETAARFSFLLSIPAITASGLLELKEALRILPADTLWPMIVAIAVSGIVGYLSIWFLLAYLRRNSTAIFVIYRLILGVVLLILLWFGIVSPVVA